MSVLGEERRVIGLMLGRARAAAAARGSDPAACDELLAYAEARLAACPFGESKPTCRSCPVHCYDASHRDRMRELMRVTGPWMLARHPLLSLRHYYGRNHGSRE